MKFIKTDNSDQIAPLRTLLYKKFKAPIDGMWEMLYIASSQHYIIELNDDEVGYCCIDAEKSLVQLFLIDAYQAQMMEVVKGLIDSQMVIKAKLSSMEPIAFNACLFHSKSIETNTFCYHFRTIDLEGTELDIVQVADSDISGVKAFMKDQIGFDDTFGYTENLVQRQELYMVKENDIIVGTSECRLSDSQVDIADIGVIVNKDFQGRGIATQILNQQAKRVLNLNRRPICSTTKENIASQKAIAKAGFYNESIIFDIYFS